MMIGRGLEVYMGVRMRVCDGEAQKVVNSAVYVLTTVATRWCSM
jgi:hypothetical protein